MTHKCHSQLLITVLLNYSLHTWAPFDSFSELNKRFKMLSETSKRETHVRAKTKRKETGNKK